MRKHTPGMFLTDFHTRKYTGGIISHVGIFFTVTPVTVTIERKFTVINNSSTLSEVSMAVLPMEEEALSRTSDIVRNCLISFFL